MAMLGDKADLTVLDKRQNTPIGQCQDPRFVYGKLVICCSGVLHLIEAIVTYKLK